MASALQSDLMLEDIVMNALHSDSGPPPTDLCLEQPGVQALRQAVADLNGVRMLQLGGSLVFIAAQKYSTTLLSAPG